MERVYSYAILQAVPDLRRGERVNIGIVVFKDDGLDIQVFESRKIRSLTGRSWDAFIDSYSNMLRDFDDPSRESADRLKSIESAQGDIILSKSGWFKARSTEQYHSRIKEIVKTIVSRPSSTRKKGDATIVAEISAELRSSDVLASKDETLESGKVVRNFDIEPGLQADFAQLNSKLHVATVLDLRSTHPQLAQAALKAIVLDRAAAVHGGSIHKIGVYSVAPARRREVQENIGLLGRYADDIVNWEDRTDRQSLKRLFFDAYNSHIDEIQTDRYA